MLLLRGGAENIFMQLKQDIIEKHKTPRCSVCSMFVNIQIVNYKKKYIHICSALKCVPFFINFIAAKSHFTSVHCHISWTTDNRVVQILFYIAHYLKKQKLIIHIEGKKHSLSVWKPIIFVRFYSVTSTFLVFFEQNLISFFFLLSFSAYSNFNKFLLPLEGFKMNEY